MHKTTVAVILSGLAGVFPMGAQAATQHTGDLLIMDDPGLWSWPDSADFEGSVRHGSCSWCFTHPRAPEP